MERYDELLSILKKETNPARGCTGPVSVAFAGAAAARAVGGIPKRIKLILDKDTYKNCLAVCTPGTRYMGVVYPTILGAFYGDPDLGLEVLNTVGDYDPEMIEDFKARHFETEIFWDYKGISVYCEAIVETENGTGRAVVARSHAHLVRLEANGTCLFEEEGFRLEDLAYETEDPIRGFTVPEFFRFASEATYSDISFLEKAIELNQKLADAGLESGAGGQFGAGFQKMEGDPMYLKAKIYAAAASDARMGGINLSAMSCATSGNVGITASLPLVYVAEQKHKDREELVRAIALSYLLTIYVKSNIGRLSAMCACAIGAGIGVAGGTAFLLSGTEDKVEGAIKNLVGSIGGVICDGAKYGCALKLSSAAGIAIESAELAAMGVIIPDMDGFVCENADETIRMLGHIAREGMRQTDETVCRAFVKREEERR